MEANSGSEASVERVFIRILGSISLVGGICFFIVGAARGPYAPITTKELVIPTVAFSVIGLGLLFLRRSAAVALSLISSPLGLWMIIGSLLKVPFPWYLFNLGFGVTAFMPLFALIFMRKAFKGW